MSSRFYLHSFCPGCLAGYFVNEYSINLLVRKHYSLEKGSNLLHSHSYKQVEKHKSRLDSLYSEHSYINIILILLISKKAWMLDSKPVQCTVVGIHSANRLGVVALHVWMWSLLKEE